MEQDTDSTPMHTDDTRKPESRLSQYSPLLFILLAFGMMWLMFHSFLHEIQTAEDARIEAKSDYILSNNYTTHSVLGAAWESRSSNDTTPRYDVFLLDTEEDGLIRVSIDDTEVNNKYPVEQYTIHSE